MDGLFEWVEEDTNQDLANPESNLRFHEATALTHELLERLQHTIRRRVLRHFARHGLLDPYDAEDMHTWNHGGGFSLDAGVRIEATDRAGLERLILPPPRIHRHRYHGVFAPNAPLRPILSSSRRKCYIHTGCS